MDILKSNGHCIIDYDNLDMPLYMFKGDTTVGLTICRIRGDEVARFKMTTHPSESTLEVEFEPMFDPIYRDGPRRGETVNINMEWRASMLSDILEAAVDILKENMLPRGRTIDIINDECIPITDDWMYANIMYMKIDWVECENQCDEDGVKSCARSLAIFISKVMRMIRRGNSEPMFRDDSVTHHVDVVVDLKGGHTYALDTTIRPTDDGCECTVNFKRNTSRSFTMNLRRGFTIADFADNLEEAIGEECNYWGIDVDKVSKN